MNPRVRQGLIVAGCAILAVMLGWQLADGKIFTFDLVGFVVTGAVLLALGAILVKVFRLPADVVVLGAVVFGYIVGDRGFAQLMPSPNLPLLPAEGALLLTGGWWLAASAFEGRLPWNRDLLNRLILLWLLAGTVRLLFDVRTYGILAVRDFATIYYAAFFFVAQRMSRHRRSRRYLVGCAFAGTLLLLPGLQLYDAFPRFFLTQLLVQGAPLIYYKGDLAYTFLAVGSLLVFFAASGRHRYWAWPLSAGYFLYVAAGDNRASLFGLLIVTLLLLVALRWRYPAVQAAAAALALGTLVALSSTLENPWAGQKLHAVADRVESMADTLQALQARASPERARKSDNNRFRLVWWANVAEETWKANPAFGLGFGYDLARGFVQEYSPDLTEEFTARSPHSIFFTVLGRMGAAGLALWIAICTVIAGETWRTLRREPERLKHGLWCALWVILVSASFGVVLEGPMGAVPFWVLLGLAHGWNRAAPGGGRRDGTGAADRDERVETTASLRAEPAGV